MTSAVASPKQPAKLHLKFSVLRQAAFYRGCDPGVPCHAGNDDMPVSRGDFIRQKVGMALEVTI